MDPLVSVASLQSSLYSWLKNADIWEGQWECDSKIRQEMPMWFPQPGVLYSSWRALSNKRKRKKVQENATKLGTVTNQWKSLSHILSPSLSTTPKMTWTKTVQIPYKTEKWWQNILSSIRLDTNFFFSSFFSEVSSWMIRITVELWRSMRMPCLLEHWKTYWEL